MALDRKEGTMGGVLVLFIGVLVVLSLMPAIAGGASRLTTKLQMINDTDVLTTCYAEGERGEVNTSNALCNQTLIQAPSGWQTGGACPITNLVVKTQNGSYDLVLDTDYTFDANTGIVSYLNDTTTNGTTFGILGAAYNTTYLTFNYCDLGYSNSSATRTITGLITLFAALAVMAFTVFYIAKLWVK